LTRINKTLIKNLQSPLWRVSVSVLSVGLLQAGSLIGQEAQSFTQRLQKILERPEYRHSTFGIEILSLASKKPLFQLREQELFTPGSTTKLLTEGAAIELLGADFRFRTAVYKTGKVNDRGVLTGDIVLVASGDPNLSSRIQADGTLAFENEDHSYGGNENTKLVPGNPLAVIDDLAKQIASNGIKEIRGRVLVDIGLFPEGERELGTGVVISPICVNDNVVDFTISPGVDDEHLASVKVSPETSYVKFINKVRTVKGGGRLKLDDPAESQNADGSYTVTLNGTSPLGSSPVVFSYAVPQPSRFAQTVLMEALKRQGVKARMSRAGEKIDFHVLSKRYTDENVIATHTSPPLAEEVKVTLKVSQNLHASMVPYLLGALVAKAKSNIEQAGFDRERDFLRGGDLDLAGASQADGAGGAESAFFTPDFMVRYLAYLTGLKNFATFKKSLPVLGRDGTLFNIQTQSPAAGQVFAKTGTFSAVDKLNRRLMLTGKGLAGYTETPGGEPVSFALYINRVSLPLDDPDAVTNSAGQALGEIAAAIRLLPIDKMTLQ
jgi:PBP4 family serine-type D-alanyl-D-alanine carboxypeptidase